jgi:arsenite-transporting ATPase
VQRPTSLSERPAFLRASDARLLFFGGKGGVGKTTCAAATALHLAARFPDERFLAVSVDPAHSLRDSFDGLPPPANLALVEINSRECLDKFKAAHAQHLRQIAVRGTFLDEDDIAQLLDLSMPGLDEVMAFEAIAALVKTRAYSRIIVDTAPTGHALRFLGLPGVLREWFGAIDAMLAKYHYMAKLYRGFHRNDETDLFLEGFRELTERLADLLRDPERCLFVPVMLAEPLSLCETRRLVDRLEKMRVPVRDILVNCLHPAAGECPACRGVRYQQRVMLERIGREFQRYAVWEIPLHGAETQGAGLSGFWDRACPFSPVVEAPRPTRLLSPRVEHAPDLPGPEVALVLFAGKGGVGKTTLASATALRLAEAYADREVVLVSMDPAHSLSDCLGMRVGPQGTPIARGLTAMEIDAEAEFQELKKRYADEVAGFFDRLLSGQETVDLEFEREAVERVLDLSPPGLDELMAIARVVAPLEAGDRRTIVLDAAPTGHLVRLLELPGLVHEWLGVMIGLLLKYKKLFWLPSISESLLVISRRIRMLRSLLTNPVKGQLYAVSIPTAMAFEETRDLIAACRRAGIHVPVLFLNQATPDSRCAVCSGLFQAESGVRARFHEEFRGVRQCVVVRCGELQGPDRLAELGQALYRR